MPDLIPNAPVMDADGAIFPEPCPTPSAFQVDGCQDSVSVRLSDTSLQSLGRVVQVDVTLKNVCPGKQAAAAIFLTEEDAAGTEHNRGFKTVAIPALVGTQCRDVTLRCINFVVPEAPNPDGTPGSICTPRRFHARVLANYTDTDYICCTADTVMA